MPTASKTITVEEYLGMIRDGTLDEDDRVELLDGEIVEKMSKNPPHAVVTGLAQDWLQSVLPLGWFVRKEDTVRLTQSVPEPDLAVIRGTRRDYATGHPEVDAIGLLVEVADSTLSQDRGIKKSIYARSNVPGYWIINLRSSRIEVFSNPAAGEYQDSQLYGPDEELPLILDGQEVARVLVRDLLP